MANFKNGSINWKYNLSRFLYYCKNSQAVKGTIKFQPCVSAAAVTLLNSTTNLEITAKL